MKALGSLLRVLGGVLLGMTVFHFFVVGVPRLQGVEVEPGEATGVWLSYLMVGLICVVILAIGQYIADRARREERRWIARASSSSSVAGAFSSSWTASGVRCTKCQGELEYLGDPRGMFSPTASVIGPPSAFRAMEQWRGNVCVKCRSVYCEKCIELGGPTPCPNCGEPTYPAQRMYLEQAGRL